MSDLNSLQIMGRVVRDATLKEVAGGVLVSRFSIATNISQRDENGNFVNQGHFFPLVLFGTYAEKMQPYLKKGQRIIVEGYLRQNRWISEKENGKKKSETMISVKSLHLIFDSKTKTNSENLDDSSELTQEQMAHMVNSEMDDSDFYMDDEDYSEFDNEDAVF